MHEVNLQWPVPNDRLQALRVHRLFAAPLGAGRMTASRRFVFIGFLLPHWVPAAWRSREQNST